MSTTVYEHAVELCFFTCSMERDGSDINAADVREQLQRFADLDDSVLVSCLSVFNTEKVAQLDS